MLFILLFRFVLELLVEIEEEADVQHHAHHLEGLGIGTIAAAFTMGKAIGFAGDVLDKHFRFGTYKTLKKESC